MERQPATAIGGPNARERAATSAESLAARTEDTASARPAAQPRDTQRDTLVAALGACVTAAAPTDTLRASCEAGALIFEQVYRSDADLVSKRGPKPRSLIALTEALGRRGVTVTASLLRKYVHRHLILRELLGDASPQRLCHLSASHVDEVAALPPGDRAALLERAEREGLSTAEVRRCARAKGGTAGPRRGSKVSRARRRRGSRVPAIRSFKDVETRLRDLIDRSGARAAEVSPPSPSARGAAARIGKLVTYLERHAQWPVESPET